MLKRYTAFGLRTLMQNKSNNFASYYASQEAKAVAQSDSVIKAYNSLD